MRTKKLFFLLSLLLLFDEVFAINTILTGFRIGTADKIINAHGICKKIKSLDGKERFVPTQTTTGWHSFLNNKPINIEFSACHVPEALWCWGSSPLPGLSNTHEPEQFESSSWNKVGIGVNSFCAISSGNNLQCWGMSPSYLSSLADTIEFGLAGHVCAIKDDNTLWCWGHTYLGKLGIGRKGGIHEYEHYPKRLPGTWKDVSAGLDHTCGITTDNTLSCWGSNSDSRLGIGSNDPSDNQPSPVQVGSDNDWKNIYLGNKFACATKNNNTLWCWGDNRYGQLGQNDAIDRSTPVQVGTDTWKSIGIGKRHLCAIKTDNTLWCWGGDHYGQLGQGKRYTGSKRVPTQVGSENTWESVASGYSHSCAIKNDGALWCWGSGNHGELGSIVPSYIGYSTTPLRVGSDNDWKNIGLGMFYTCGIRE